MKGFAAFFQSEDVPPSSCYLESFSHDFGCLVNFFSHLEIIIWFLPFILLSRKEELLRIVHRSEQMERTTVVRVLGKDRTSRIERERGKEGRREERR